MVVDTSALLAILLDESGSDAFASAVAKERSALLPVSCYLEASINMRRRGRPRAMLDEYIGGLAIGIVAADERQARIAVEADRRYGRGTGHPARLNFGDCLAYAAALSHDAPLLFKGEDFGHTDVKRAA